MLTAVTDQQHSELGEPYRRLFVRDCLTASHQGNALFRWGAPSFDFNKLRISGDIVGLIPGTSEEGDPIIDAVLLDDASGIILVKLPPRLRSKSHSLKPAKGYDIKDDAAYTLIRPLQTIQSYETDIVPDWCNGEKYINSSSDSIVASTPSDEKHTPGHQNQHRGFYNRPFQFSQALKQQRPHQQDFNQQDRQPTPLPVRAHPASDDFDFDDDDDIFMMAAGNSEDLPRKIQEALRQFSAGASVVSDLGPLFPVESATGDLTACINEMLSEGLIYMENNRVFLL
ncbi:hypothetical protein SeLEV6574_g02426 [Synchytrium endobioticum]|nr:hypothetical protein SeLEV6574_g02426 [Synchytrium endobioticum]